MHLRYFNFNKGISLEDFENKINLSIIFATLSYCHTESMEMSLKSNPNILPREIILPLNLNYTESAQTSTITNFNKWNLIGRIQAIPRVRRKRL